jgi:hypothetical protein
MSITAPIPLTSLADQLKHKDKIASLSSQSRVARTERARLQRVLQLGPDAAIRSKSGEVSSTPRPSRSRWFLFLLFAELAVFYIVLRLVYRASLLRQATAAHTLSQIYRFPSRATVFDDPLRPFLPCTLLPASSYSSIVLESYHARALPPNNLRAHQCRRSSTSINKHSIRLNQRFSPRCGC